MKESVLVRAYGGLRPVRVEIQEGEYVHCPGFRASGCLTMIPKDRYLCQFCTETAKRAVEPVE